MVELPDVVRNRAVSEGRGDWVTELPDIVRSLAGEWSITIGRAYDEGTEAFVADAVLDDGTAGILKIMVPRRGGGFDDHEATVLRLAAGDGCPLLYR
ncbi:MAG: aminoglycoside phosphotransferase family protein, partial [Ilumatobacteraceae bacterium]